MLELTPPAPHVAAWVLAFGAGVLVLGTSALASFVLLILRDRPRRRAPVPPPKDDPRWSGESRPQRVGRACACCGAAVRVEPEATTCESCGDVCHVRCVSRHAAAVHAPGSGPFR